MAKLDDLMRSSRDIASESMGATRGPAMPWASAPAAPATPAHLQGITRSKSAAEIPLAKIGSDPSQPRTEFDAEELQRLADSLKTRGQLQPIRVRWDEAQSLYVIVCGERRWRAAGLAGLATMSCVIMEGPITSADLLAIQLIENCVREDLKPIEQARAFKALIDQNGWSARQVARELAITQSNVVRALALLDLLEAVQAQVEQGALSPRTAYEVSKLGDAETIKAVAAEVTTAGLSRDETVERVRQVTKARAAKGKGRAAAKAGPPRPRTFRLAGGKVILEPKKVGGPEALLAMAEEVVEALGAELGSRAQDVA